MAYRHRSKYRFYMQLVKERQSDAYKGQVEIESTFNCIYCKLTNVDERGDIKNIVEESYAEKSGVRVYVPEKADLAFTSQDLELTLLFIGKDVIENERAFINWCVGRKFEWYDTFRGRYISCIINKKPTVVVEKLYAGNGSYRQVKYTLRNIDGVTYATSQL